VPLISRRVSPRCRPMSHCGRLRRSSQMLAEGNRAGGLGFSESIIIGEGALLGGDGRRGTGSKDSMPGRRMFCCWGPLPPTEGNDSDGSSS
jgi:hypothetical protein